MEKPPFNVAQKYWFTFSSWLPWAIQTYRPTVYKTGVAAAISLVLVTYLTLLSHWGSGSPCRHDITSENWFYHWKKQSIHIRVRRKLRTLWDCAPSNSHYSRNHKVLSKKYLAIPRPKRFETNINVVSRLQMTVTHRTMLKNYIASKNLDWYGFLIKIKISTKFLLSDFQPLQLELI